MDKPIYDHTIREMCNGMIDTITETIKDISNKNTNKLLTKNHRLFYFGFMIVFLTLILLIIF